MKELKAHIKHDGREIPIIVHQFVYGPGGAMAIFSVDDGVGFLEMIHIDNVTLETSHKKD